ncbi:MAG: hypothetical protein ACMG6S_02605 [Byssovorax sp.]
MEAVENANALNVNALNANALNANALALNAINASALDVNALNPTELSALKHPGEAGYLSRQLMKYVVSCALGPAQSFSFSWTDILGDVHAEIYPGQLGLATSWSQAPLDLQGQQWISACLASRVNWYGVSVTLSSRGSHPALDKESLDETLTYATEEGAFWGNLFTSPPSVFACSDTLGIAHARAKQRDCAAGHIDQGGNIQECGILHIVGSCAAYCQPLDLFGAYHPRCVSNLDGSLLFGPFLNNPTATTSAITVFLD